AAGWTTVAGCPRATRTSSRAAGLFIVATPSALSAVRSRLGPGWTLPTRWDDDARPQDRALLGGRGEAFGAGTVGAGLLTPRLAGTSPFSRRLLFLVKLPRG